MIAKKYDIPIKKMAFVKWILESYDNLALTTYSPDIPKSPGMGKLIITTSSQETLKDIDLIIKESV